MKDDEIKELIRDCNELLNDEFFTLNNIDITRHELTLLLDYITNLQQELQRKDNIINDLKNGIKELDNMFYETFRISQDGYFSISEWELKDFTDKINELEGDNM